jgi:hypothetical protein
MFGGLDPSAHPAIPADGYCICLGSCCGWSATQAAIRVDGMRRMGIIRHSHLDAGE